jgi:hypothetical protein
VTSPSYIVGLFVAAEAMGACGGKVVIDDDSTSTGASTTTGSTTGAGVGGAVIGTTSATTSATVGAGGSSATCGEGVIDLDVGGVPVELLSGCDGTPGGSSTAPSGVELLIPGGVELGLEGCASSVQNPSVRVGISNAKGPGTYTGGAVNYTDGDGGVWMGIAPGFQATIDQLGPVGGHIVGSLQATIAQGGVEQPMQGTFSVCRVPDFAAP